MSDFNTDGFFDIAVKVASKANPILSGDYEKDGLMYCGKCHTPKQAQIPFEGTDHIVPVMCNCAQIAFEKEESERQDRERAFEIRRLKANGINDKAFRDFTFANDDGKKLTNTERAHKYVNSWDRVCAENLGLLFWGNTGTGKSFTAGCIGNALIENCVPVLMTSSIKLLSAISALWADERTSFIDSLKNYKLLIIDDLGAERDTSFALEIMNSVIDARDKQKLPTIITTNLTISELKDPKDMSYKRIYDRVLRMCTPIFFDGESRRKAEATEKMKKINEIFGR